ncbi:MAG: helix-turn-helix domain-containing protein [Sphingobacteriaceae bacterium]|nr:helix-turn-helix domain-containing protein [Sphingobacteriaceae bacterium]
MEKLEFNIQFEQVLGFINQTSKSVFLTGKAGTGKTTLLKYIKSNTYKNMAIVAPTGVAAINAGGSTIHSFFQFPFTPFIPQFNDDGTYKKNVTSVFTQKYTKQRLSIFRNLDVLVIDEVSMVRADMMDQIDACLKFTRKKWDLPFGGVQVLLIGDMFQLAPVINSEEQNILKSVYKGFYFFNSLIIQKEPPVYIELEKIFRQKESNFIELLNKVRNNRLGLKDLGELNEKYKKEISDEERLTYITLTTHNKKAEEINSNSMSKIKEKEFSYKAKVEGIFQEKSYPADEILKLKKGARVMFLKNNSEKNFYNGKTGIVTFLGEDEIKVKCDEDKYEIEVPVETWNNVSYQVNNQTTQIEENVLGTFKQFPLRQAWAITIHKSQGLTFDHLIIDAEEAFSSGQVYVALSRCRSLNGLILSSKLNISSIINDSKILEFADTKHSHKQVNDEFNQARRKFTVKALFDVFSMEEMYREKSELSGSFILHKSKLNKEGVDWLSKNLAKIDELYEVSVKFQVQLEKMLVVITDVEQDVDLKERIVKAAEYFNVQLNALKNNWKDIPVRTQSKEAADDLNPFLNTMLEMMHVKCMKIQACSKGFNLSDLISAKLKMKIPEIQVNIYSSARNTKIGADVKHPELYRELLFLRDEICNDEQLPIYMVLKNESLKQMAEFLPVNQTELLEISGFGNAKVESFGDRFLKRINSYLKKNNLSGNMNNMISTKKKGKSKKTKAGTEEELTGVKVDTKKISFDYFKELGSVSEVAKKRGMATSTIETHLLKYVIEGEININDLVSKKIQDKITKKLPYFNKTLGLKSIKEQLPESVTYSEIKFVLAHNKVLD